MQKSTVYIRQNQQQQQIDLKKTDQVRLRKGVASRNRSFTDKEYIELKEDQRAFRALRVISRIIPKFESAHLLNRYNFFNDNI